MEITKKRKCRLDPFRKLGYWTTFDAGAHFLLLFDLDNFLPLKFKPMIVMTAFIYFNVEIESIGLIPQNKVKKNKTRKPSSI